MRVLIFNSALTHGGVERQISYLTAGLRERGHSVTLVVLDHEPTGQDLIRLRWPGFFRRGVTKFLHLPGFLRRFSRLVREVRPDIIHTWGPYENLVAAWAGKRLRVPVLASVRTNRPWAFKFARFWAQRTSGVVVNAQQVAATLRDEYGLSSGRIHLVRNALPLEQYPFFSRRQFDPKTVALGVVGRLSPSKNQLLLLDVLPELQRDHPETPFTLALIGSEEHSDYRQTIYESIHFHNLERHVSIRPYTDEIQQVYREIDILVLPSRSEGLPNVLLEAMAMGTPWIASDIADNAWLAGDARERGILFEDDSPESLREALELWLAESVAEKRRRAASGRAFVEDTFSVEKTIARFESIYERAMKQPEDT